MSPIGTMRTVKRVQNLRNFNSRPYFKYIVLVLMAHKCERDSGEQKTIFMNLDADHDGALSKEEIKTALRNHAYSPRESAMDDVNKILD